MDITPERQYAEELAVAMEVLGMSRMAGRVLGWLLICDPPEQTAGQLVEALRASKGSISTVTRQLASSGLIVRKSIPGIRADVFEMRPDAFTRASEVEKLAWFKDLMNEGIKVIGDENSPRARRLKGTRDFYAFMERETPKLIEKFKREYMNE